MIEFDLHYRQGDFQLNARLQTPERVIGLYGPSGSGKTTLLNLLAGNLRPMHGSIRIAGHRLFDSALAVDIPPQQRRIGMVFQEGRLFPHLSARHNLTYGMRLLKPAQRRFELDHIAGLLELTPLLDRKPWQLSGGERQRVALGRALLASPHMLLLDEPMAALDDRLKSQILPFLVRVRDEADMPILYVSHAMDEMQSLVHGVVRLEQGRIVGDVQPV